MNHTVHFQVTPLDAMAALEVENGAAGAWLLDVREAPEVARAAYAVARCIHIPLSELQARHAELPRDVRLIVACAAGGRSQQAMQFLQHRGHTQVYNLAGGLAAWMAHGLPVQSSV